VRGIKILERILGSIPIMLGVCLVVFVFMRLIPGDPVDIMIGEASHVTAEELAILRSQFNLDQPIHVQLSRYLVSLLRGDLGYSISRSRDVSKVILEAIPATVELALAAMIFALAVAIPLGVLSSVKHNSAVDRGSMALAFVGISTPAFWLGVMLIIVFAANLRWLPTSGRITYGFAPANITGLYILDSLLTLNVRSLLDSLKHLVLPAIALGAAPCAVITRVVRSEMLEVLRKDYITFARTKGVPEIKVIFKHALRNALIPATTVAGLETGTLLGGNMIIETVFGWPGMGRLVVDGIFSRDYSLVQGSVMVYALTFVLVNLIVDILYTYLNPRISMEKTSA